MGLYLASKEPSWVLLNCWVVLTWPQIPHTPRSGAEAVSPFGGPELRKHFRGIQCGKSGSVWKRNLAPPLTQGEEVTASAGGPVDASARGVDADSSPEDLPTSTAPRNQTHRHTKTRCVAGMSDHLRSFKVMKEEETQGTAQVEVAKRTMRYNGLSWIPAQDGKRRVEKESRVKSAR